MSDPQITVKVTQQHRRAPLHEYVPLKTQDNRVIGVILIVIMLALLIWQDPFIATATLAFTALLTYTLTEWRRGPIMRQVKKVVHAFCFQKDSDYHGELQKLSKEFLLIWKESRA